MIRGIALVLVFVLALSAGCYRSGGDPTAKVTGALTLNGKPARGFSVVFHPTKGRPATGITDKDGRFSLSTFGPDDGAVLGQHVVTIADSFPDGPPPMGAAAIKSRAPQQYSAPTTSPLRASVKADEKNEFTFDLKS